MAKSNIFLPRKIKVGYQKRSGTYTGQLAYVIYYDATNKLRKEKSWESWRDSKIAPNDFENVPTSGFVLNKRVGGYNTGWNHRNTYVRVYDPRNFEFEITVENLLYILENTSSIKGKGLEGEFVYGWDGKDLLLIPTSSPDYVELEKYNDIVHNNDFIKPKEFVVGHRYLSLQNEEFIYMGRMDYYDYSTYDYEIDEYSYELKGKKHWFAHSCGFYKEGEYSFTTFSSPSKKFISDLGEVGGEFANIFTQMENNPHYSPPKYDKVKKPMDFERFCQLFGEEYCSRIKHFCDKNGEIYQIHLKGGSNDQYYVHPRGTEHYKSLSWRENVYIPTMTLQEAYDKHKPQKLEIYLENGKLYKIKEKF